MNDDARVRAFPLEGGQVLLIPANVPHRVISAPPAVCGGDAMREAARHMNHGFAVRRAAEELVRELDDARSDSRAREE